VSTDDGACHGSLVKLALAQVNPTVGDISGNSTKIIECIRRAQEEQVELVVFPELALVGCGPQDLLLKPRFIDDNLAALEDIAAACTGTAALVGYVSRHSGTVGRGLYNAVALLADGKITTSCYKQLLATHNTGDESRYFDPGPSPQIVELGGRRIGVSIGGHMCNGRAGGAKAPCEDQPFAKLVQLGPDLIVNIAASPFVIDKDSFRCDFLAEQCRRYSVPLVYVNQVGGNDEIVCDGNSCALDKTGRVIAQARDFDEDLLIVDLAQPDKSRQEQPRGGIAAVRAALVLGLRDYVRKCNFSSVVLGLSGGIDSAVVAVLATEAIGPGNVLGVVLPSRHSSDHSRTDARQLARNLGIHYLEVPIEPAHAAMESMLTEVFSGCEPDVTEENVQARIRCGVLMALSNKFGHLLLATGNKSESAVGYCTMYGDMAGGLAVIGDVPKTMVYELADYLNREKERIPASIFTKAPSAELRPGQKDQDSLPAYDVLDDILQRYVEQEESLDEIVAAGFEAELVARVIGMIDRAEYKRRQGPPALRITSGPDGFGCRMPIAQNYQPYHNQTFSR